MILTRFLWVDQSFSNNLLYKHLFSFSAGARDSKQSASRGIVLDSLGGTQDDTVNLVRFIEVELKVSVKIIPPAPVPAQPNLFDFELFAIKNLKKIFQR